MALQYFSFHLKGLCHKLAVEKGLNHGRLPIGENIDLKTRKVLTIDHGQSKSLKCFFSFRG